MSTYEALKYTFTGANLTSIPTSAITSGTFADARISSGSVTQHVSAVTNTSGTWTPTLYTSNQDFSASTYSTSARYIRVGDLVFCSAIFRATSGNSTGGDSTDLAYMGGLPITSANITYPGAGSFRSVWGSNGLLLVHGGQTYVTFTSGSSRGAEPPSTSGDAAKRLHINDQYASTKNYYSVFFTYRV